MKLNNKIKKYCILNTSKILDVYKLFQKNENNFAIVVNKECKFLGIVTPTDIRKAIIKGTTLKSNILKTINTNPIIIKGKIDNNKINSIISRKNYSDINPPLIPLINKQDVPYDVIWKDKINFLKNKKNKEKKNKEIVLLGGAGYIGSVLTKQLVQEGFNVCVFDKFIYLNENKFKKIISSKNLTCINGDSRHLEKVFNVIRRADAVVHLAEMVGDPLCEKRPEKTYSINYLASISIASICKNLGIEKFIYVSSCSVYGSNLDKQLLNESSPINPLSVYAKLKAICEKAIITNFGNYFKPCILRLGTVYGVSHRPRYDLVVNLFSGLAANKKKINIEGGEQWRPFINVKDVSSIITKILKLPKEKSSGQIFNVVSENITIKNLGKKIQKLFPNIDISIKKTKKDFRDYKVSSDKAKKILKFRPKYFLDKEIKLLVNFTKKNKIKNINSKEFVNILNSDKF